MPAAEIEVEVDSTYPENFDVFLARFNSDSMFQLSRIKFPIEEAIKDPHEGNDAYLLYHKDAWRLISLEYRREHHDGVKLDFQQDTIWDQNEVVIQQRGGYVNSSNSIWDVDYTFTIIDDRWFLVAMKDFGL